MPMPGVCAWGEGSIMSFEHTAREYHEENERERIREEVMQWLIDVFKARSYTLWKNPWRIGIGDVERLFEILGDTQKEWEEELYYALQEGKPNAD